MNCSIITKIYVFMCLEGIIRNMQYTEWRVHLNWYASSNVVNYRHLRRRLALIRKIRGMRAHTGLSFDWSLGIENMWVFVPPNFYIRWYDFMSGERKVIQVRYLFSLSGVLRIKCYIICKLYKRLSTQWPDYYSLNTYHCIFIHLCICRLNKICKYLIPYIKINSQNYIMRISQNFVHWVDNPLWSSIVCNC